MASGLAANVTLYRNSGRAGQLPGASCATIDRLQAWLEAYSNAFSRMAKRL